MPFKFIDIDIKNVLLFYFTKLQIIFFEGNVDIFKKNISLFEICMF